MRYFGWLTRALTMFCGLQIMLAAFWGFGLNGVQIGPVIGLFVGGLLLTLPIIEHGMRQAAATTRQP